MPLPPKEMKGVADVVICVDCTGSMEPCITELKGHLDAFISELDKPSSPNQQAVNWRLRIIGFRDLVKDSTPWVNRDAPMVASADEARAQVALLKEEGGDDEPESALDALWYAAEKTEWREPCTKVVVLFSDATTLPTLHKDTVADGAVGDDVSTVSQALANQHINLFAWVPKCPEYETLAGLGLSEFEWQSGADGLKTIDFKKTLQILAKTVSNTTAANAAGAKTEHA